MLRKIKYTYIPQKKSMDAILSSLSYAIKATGALDYKIIDNKAKGRRLYPSQLSDSVITCEKDELLKIIEQIVEDDVEVILLNGFDLELDEIRESFCNIVKDYDILLCINNIIDLENSESNISVFIDPDVDELDEDEWESVKEDISKSLEERKEDIKNNKSSQGLQGSSALSNLLDLFNLDTLYSDKPDKGHDLLDVEDIDIKEQYSYATKKTEMCISLTESDEILITCDDDYVVVPKEQIQFLFDTLKKLMK